MRPLLAALLSCVWFALAAPAFAVDRQTGAVVPKPVASGDPWTDADVAALVSDVDGMLGGAAQLRSAHAGLFAVDARDGRVLYAHNADEAFVPASTLKLVTGSAALDLLGPAFRFRTEATIENAVVDGVLRGDLTLRGGGDVLLDGRALAELTAALRAARIATIGGDVVAAPEPLEYPPGWAVDDTPWSYAPPVTALNYADDEVVVTVTPGAARGDPVSATVAPWGSASRDAAACKPRELGFCILVRATTGAGSASALDAVRDDPLHVAIVGTLGIAAKPETLELAAASPPAFAAAAVRRALLRSDMTVARNERAGVSIRHSTIWTHDSEPLTDLVADTWIPSDNVLAESLLRALGAKPPARRATREAGIAAETAWLAQLGVDPNAGTDLEDGSGLSAYDRITPRTIVTVLRHDWDGPYRDAVLDALPIAGVRGTLASSFVGTPAAGRVFAKTGTLTHAGALAGYVATAHHGTVIFAFDVDDWTGEPGELRALRGRVLSRFAGS